MKTRAQSSAPCERRWTRWLLYALIGLTAAGGHALAQTATSAVATTTYRVIPLSPDSTVVAYINARGQVAFETQDSVVRAHFYDGRTVHDLGTLGGPDATVAGLDQFGRVAGSSTIDPGGQTYHAYRWSRATGMVDLTPALQFQSSGVGINDSGEVAGFADTAPYVGHGALWSPGAPQLDIPLNPTAVNDAETVVGVGGNSPTAVHALMWTRAQGVRDLGATPGEDTTANNISRIGHIVGTSGLRAFLWTPREGLIDLGSGSASGSTAVKANDRDVVVGYNRYGPSCPAVHYCHGFIWTRPAGFMEIISAGSPADVTSARDVNRAGHVVGSVDGHAYLWSRGRGFVDLNTRLAHAPAGLRLLEGVGISDNGAIVAIANTGLVLLVPNCACRRQAPVVGPVELADAARTDVPLSFSVTLTAAEASEIRKATWSWGDGGTEPAGLSDKAGAGSASGQHVYRSPGIYTVALTINDSDGNATTVRRQIAVAGQGAHVAGSGQFMSPPGASRLAPGRSGLASFAILSGTSIDGAAPQATARIEFTAAGVRLVSAHIDTVAIQDRALRYAGTGTVNGRGGYHFTLVTFPATGSGGSRDRIRIRIWHEAADSKADIVDYDNAPDGVMTGPDGGGSVVEYGSIVFQPS